jgi:type IV pilus assembly protein PilE
MKRTPGFTLIEMLVVVALLAIVASLAVPAYFDSLRKSRRAEAVAGLTAIQQAQERRRANEPRYTTELAMLGLPSSALGSSYYTFRVTEASATGYTVTATALAGTSQAKDERCTTMLIRMAEGNIRYGSACASCTLADPPTDPSRCWSRQ